MIRGWVYLSSDLGCAHQSCGGAEAKTKETSQREEGQGEKGKEGSERRRRRQVRRRRAESQKERSGAKGQEGLCWGLGALRLGAKNSHRITKRFATDFSAPAALTSLLFRPSGARNHWKNTVFSRTWIFFLLTISSLILRSDLLSSSPVFSASSHLSGCVCSRMPSHST